MSKITWSLLLLAAAAPVWCQPPGGFGRGGMMRSPAFQALDTDGDGVISAAELANAGAQTSFSISGDDRRGASKRTAAH